MAETLIIIMTGALSGISSGMFGIGGSVISTPLLRLLLEISPLIALASPLPAAIPSAGAGSVFYAKSKLIRYKIALPAILAAIPMGMVGSYATALADSEIILVTKAVFLLLLGLKFIFARYLFNFHNQQERVSFWGGFAGGALAGLLGGFLAVGGGIVLVTAFCRINKLDMKSAVATSLFCIIILAAFNSLWHWEMGHMDTKIVLLLALTVIPFSYFGAKLASRMRNVILERSFGVAMILFAVLYILMETVYI